MVTVVHSTGKVLAKRSRIREVYREDWNGRSSKRDLCFGLLPGGKGLRTGKNVSAMPEVP